MKLIAVSIKANALNTDAKGLLCDRLTYDLSGFFVSGIRQLVSQAFRSRACGNKCRSRSIIYNLGVNMPVGTKYRQSWSVWRSKDLFSHVIFTPQRRSFYPVDSHKNQIPTALYY